MRIEIPMACRTQKVEFCLLCDRTGQTRHIPLSWEKDREDYQVWRGEFTIDEPDLFFCHFVITTENECFRLFREGEHDTNMEAGDCWQLSCVTQKFPAPDWAKGAVMYQILPDRFCRKGSYDLSEKLQPFTLHESTDEAPEWRPDARGEVLNNDFFGGTLQGIREKLPYLASLGVELAYLNPIFMAFSSHRYDTCDYKRIDPMLGTEDDLRALCRDAHKRGIRVILDGVFSHTGSRSVYFDKNAEFDGGACYDWGSRYRSWYRFRTWPTDYESWWDFKTLPCLDKNNPDYRSFIFGEADCVIAHWLSCGVDGFRLDVADELPDDFIAGLREKLRQIKPDALLLGEVWEDASNKEAYGVRRRYFTDGELDGVMNYPWRTAIFRFCRGEDDGSELCLSVRRLLENYPQDVMLCTMNLISSHDVSRALTELAAPFSGTREEMAAHILTAEQRQKGLRLLRLAAAIQFALPGMPCIYYGDEAGLEGCKDPFNRAFYPWGKEDAALCEFYKKLGNLRKNDAALRRGTTQIELCRPGVIKIVRRLGDAKTEITADRDTGSWYLNGEKQEY